MNKKHTGLDYYRVASAVLPVRVGDVAKNADDVLSFWEEAAEAGADVIVYPELCLSGYTCGDLFNQQMLLSSVRRALRALVAASAKLQTAAIVGLPLELGGQLYDCAAVLAGGRVLGITVKTFLASSGEYSEKRWFAAAKHLPFDAVESIALGLSGSAYSIPVGNDLVYAWHGTAFAAELGEDLWTALPPSTFLAMGGAKIVFNLSASNDVVGRREQRRALVRGQSARIHGGYVYASAGTNESTTDLVFSGHLMIAENGSILAENEGLTGSGMLLMDIDLGRVAADRRRDKSFADTVSQYGCVRKVRYIPTPAGELTVSESDGSLYPLRANPFVPEDSTERMRRCLEIFELQVAGLVRRLTVTHAKPVIGVSGGMDSTLALLVCTEAMRRMGRPATDVHGITMPCFGTTGRTYNNSLKLMEALGVTSREISIRDAVSGHFADIGHDPAVTDTTYENCQARERTQVLMDYAGEVGGLVVGTGDLSELALGWCTYNADHMSMYGVNAGVPKTMLRWMMDSLIRDGRFPAAEEVLRDVLATPISPELLPPEKDGTIAQQTENIVGPYALHDFFLYYMMRYGFAPIKIYTLAKRAFEGEYDEATILTWLRTFYRRFFSQQFKRSCLPDGVKVGSIGLSPRGDWRMPSDASAELWIEEVENLQN